MRLTLRIKFTLFAVIISLVMAFGTYGIFYFAAEDIIQEESLIFEEEQKNLAHEANEQLITFTHDVKILSNMPPISGMISTKESNPEEYELWIERMQKIFIAFSESKPWYMQIRYIDDTGQEVVRVDRDTIHAKVETVNDDKLQNKKDRYYFQETVKLAKGEIYTSELDLNVENGEIQIPYQPTIRYAIPVFDESGNNQGIVIINVLVDNLLSILSQSHEHINLIDEQGYFLLNNDDPDKAWGEQLGTNYQFNEENDHFNEVKLSLKGKESLVYFDEKEGYNHAEIYYKIPYNSIDSSKYWILVRQVPLSEFNAFLNSLRLEMFLVNGIIFAIFILFFSFFVYSINKPIKILTKGVEDIDKGNLKFELPIVTNDELGDLTKKFNQLVKSLEHEEADKYNFMNTASHQLRTPIAALGMQLELLKDEIETCAAKKGEKCRGYIDDLLESKRQAAELMRDLFIYFELGDTYKARKKKKIDINKIIEGVKNNLAKEIKAKRLKVDIQVTKNLTVKGEGLYIKYALINLLDNAITYSNNKGKINIRIKSEGKKTLFEFEDQGIGMPEKDLVHVFDKFFRASNSYENKNVGTGLGLFIVKLIVEGHGGEIGFETKHNKGSKFWFII